MKLNKHLLLSPIVCFSTFCALSSPKVYLLMCETHFSRETARKQPEEPALFTEHTKKKKERSISPPPSWASVKRAPDKTPSSNAGSHSAQHSVGPQQVAERRPRASTLCLAPQQHTAFPSVESERLTTAIRGNSARAPCGRRTEFPQFAARWPGTLERIPPRRELAVAVRDQPTDGPTKRRSLSCLASWGGRYEGG